MKLELNYINETNITQEINQYQLKQNKYKKTTRIKYLSKGYTLNMNILILWSKKL